MFHIILADQCHTLSYKVRKNIKYRTKFDGFRWSIQQVLYWLSTAALKPQST